MDNRNAPSAIPATVSAMTTRPRPEIPVRSADELTERWEQLLEPPVFGARSLWLAWLGPDGRMLPLVVPIDELRPVPDPTVLVNLAQLADGVARDELGAPAHVAMALCRPGRPTSTGDDEEWVAGLHAVLDEHLESTWSLHLAAGGYVTQLVAAPEALWRSMP